MKKLIVLIALLLPINACDLKNILKDDIEVAEYVCNVIGEDLFEINIGLVSGVVFRCGGTESEWIEMSEAIKQHGTVCILENQ